MWRKWLIGVLICVAPLVSIGAQTPTTGSGSTLINAWLALSEPGRIAWPYAFMRAQRTDARMQTKRADVITQIENLRWRLRDKGYSDLVHAVSAWKKRLAATRHYRMPGDWSPAWLMAHPHQRPPYGRVSAIGYCRVPKSVEIWDGNGVHDMKWRSGMRLSDVLAADSALNGGSTGEVALVWPLGDIDHYGVAAWNAADTALAPGTRIIGAIGLRGGVFPWMRDAIAKLVAHTPSGVDCRGFPLEQGTAHD